MCSNMAVFHFIILIISKILSDANANTSDMEPSIVGGWNSTIEEAPHSVLYIQEIEPNEKYTACCASIVNQNLMLTAAHCFATKLTITMRLTIYVGSTFTYPERKRNLAVRVAVHEEYVFNTFENDIALIFILDKRKPLELGANVKRVAILRNPPKVREAIICGWGRTKDVNPSEPGDLSKGLKCVEQRIRSFKVCMAILTPMGVKIPQSTICANPFEGDEHHSHPFKGDSGAGLIINGYIVVGIVSHGILIDSFHLTVYTNVSALYYWIVKTSHGLANRFCYEMNNKQQDVDDSKSCPLALLK